MNIFLTILFFLFFSTSTFCETNSKAMRIIVPFAIGGASDVYTRLVSQKITEQTGHNIIVENKIGAGGRIAFEYVAHSINDGSVIGLIDATYSMLPGLFNNLAWDVSNDMVPIALLVQTPYIVVVNSESKINTINQLILAAKNEPGKINFGSAGIGSTNEIIVEKFKIETKINVTHIPFKGMSEAILALQSGNIDFLMPASPTALGQIKGGKIRPIAVTTLKRSPALPNIPTMIESGVANYSATNWFGFAAPKGTSREIVNSLYEDITKALSSNDLREKFMLQGAEVSTLTTDEFSKFIREDTKRWTEVIKNSNIHVD
jgi:tripartite-type tricarboxylate transporter receptor subunit TctC